MLKGSSVVVILVPSIGYEVVGKDLFSQEFGKFHRPSCSSFHLHMIIGKETKRIEGPSPFRNVKVRFKYSAVMGLEIPFANRCCAVIIQSTK